MVTWEDGAQLSPSPACWVGPGPTKHGPGQARPGLVFLEWQRAGLGTYEDKPGRPEKSRPVQTCNWYNTLKFHELQVMKISWHWRQVMFHQCEKSC